jgi:hypothetical protein
VDGSGRAAVIVGAGPGGGPHVRVFKVTGGGAPPVELASFFAFDAAFAGGVHVGAGDVTGDARAEVLASAGPGGGPHVRAFTGSGGTTGVSFFAYDAPFAGGVQVAAGGLDGAAGDEIVTGAGPGGGAHVRTFTGAGGALSPGFLAY